VTEVSGDIEEWDQIESRLDAVLQGDVESLLDESLTALRSLQDESGDAAARDAGTAALSAPDGRIATTDWTSPDNDFDPNSELAQVLDNLHRMGDDPTLPAQTVSAFTSTPKAPTWIPVSGATPIGYGKTADISGAVLGVGDTAGRLPSAEGLQRLEAASRARAEPAPSAEVADSTESSTEDLELPPLPKFKLTGPEPGIDYQSPKPGAEKPEAANSQTAAANAGGAFDRAISTPGPGAKKRADSPPGAFGRAVDTDSAGATRPPAGPATAPTSTVAAAALRNKAAEQPNRPQEAPAAAAKPQPVSTGSNPNTGPPVDPDTADADVGVGVDGNTAKAAKTSRWSMRRRSKANGAEAESKMPLGQIVPIESKPPVTTTRPPGTEETMQANAVPAGTIPNLKPKVARPKNETEVPPAKPVPTKPGPTPSFRPRPPAGFEADEPKEPERVSAAAPTAKRARVSPPTPPVPKASRESKPPVPAPANEIAAPAPSGQPGTSLAQQLPAPTKSASTLDRFAAAGAAKPGPADDTSLSFDSEVDVFPTRQAAKPEVTSEPPLIDLLVTKKKAAAAPPSQRTDRVRGRAPASAATAVDDREDLVDSMETPRRGLGYLAGLLLLMIGLGAVGYALIANAGDTDTPGANANAGTVELDPHTVDVKIDGCDETGVAGTLTNSVDQLVFTTVQASFIGESGVLHHDGMLRGIEINGNSNAQYNFNYTPSLVPVELQGQTYQCSVEVQSVSARS